MPNIETRPQHAPAGQQPLNPIGQWIEKFRHVRGKRVEDMAKDFKLPGISPIRRRPAENISLYTIQQVLSGAEENHATPAEIDSLADAATVTIQEILQKKGKINLRYPAFSLKTQARELEFPTYTDTQLARELNGNIGGNIDKRHIHKDSERIRIIRNRLGITPIFTSEQAEQIRKELGRKRMQEKEEEKRRSRKKAEKEKVRSPFAVLLARVTKTPLKKFRDCLWARQTNGIPDTDTFGLLIAGPDINPDQREALTTLWLDEFRQRIRLNDLGHELGISGERVRQLKREVGSREKNLSWDTVEKIRMYREQNHSQSRRR